jgi:hypothetical protein
VKQVVGYLMLAACLVLAYQGYGNVKNTAATEGLARSLACEGVTDCLLTQEVPRGYKADFLSRQYQWVTSVGPVTTKCRRKLVFFGAWECTSALGTIGAI